MAKMTEIENGARDLTHQPAARADSNPKEATMTLRDILVALPDDAPLNDGAVDWTPDNLLMELDSDTLDAPHAWDGNEICRVGDDGYLVTPGAWRLEPQ